ncbi:MAG: 23S rRNA (guanosine(2251)-2'-O)-methyltransferase RlmB [Parachlamydiales bacterium]|jgi:23S rRNA (guanosine2251-2'-O)-methyltransferase
MKNYLIGRNSLWEVLRFTPERIIRVYALQAPGDVRSKKILELIEKQGLPVEYTHKKKLFDLVLSESHQGFVAELKPRNYLDLKLYLERSVQTEKKELAIMLDSVFDPQNFGAILRAAECFGAAVLVFSKNRGCEITPVVTKVSSGASELLEIIQVANLAESVKRFQKAGFEAIVADADLKAKSLFQYEFSAKTLLILGSEDKGVQPLIRSLADGIVKIPLKGRIDSLNVSQAAAVFLAFAGL